MEGRTNARVSVVVAVTALVFSAAGSAIATGFVIDSNRQVGPHTIAGHHPPSGKHANMIRNSIDGTDIAPNSLGGAQVDEQSLILPGLQRGSGRNVIAHQLVSCPEAGASAELATGRPGVVLNATCFTPANDPVARARIQVVNTTVGTTLRVEDASTALNPGEVAAETHLLAYDLDAGNSNILFTTRGDLLETALVAERFPTSNSRFLLLRLTAGIIVNQNAKQARFWVESSGY